MITGFNNDIEYSGSVYHVQTEDKGEASAWIESLIYLGGRILARKRVTYKQLLEKGANRPAIAKLMERQHRLMIRQVRDGRFGEDGQPAVASRTGGSPARGRLGHRHREDAATGARGLRARGGDSGERRGGAACRRGRGARRPVSRRPRRRLPGIRRQLRELRPRPVPENSLNRAAGPPSIR